MSFVAAASPLLGLPGMAGELDRVEIALRRSVRVEDPELAEMAGHLITAGGKRLRPLLAVTAGACATGELPVSDEVVLGGVSVELVQTGSLYHDDVIDEADLRRGADSVNARWGNLRAILSGDFLLAKASEIAAGLGTEVAALLASTIGLLTQGELRELQRAYDIGRSERDYLAAIDGKTSSLFLAASRIGAIVGGLSRDHVDALTAYGSAYGTAFQIVDDVLDVVASDEQLGKPAGQDLLSGIYNLPVILALASPQEGAELANVLGGPLEPVDLERARKLVAGGEGIDGALAQARSYSDLACAALAGLDPSPVVDALSASARALVNSVAVSIA